MTTDDAQPPKRLTPVTEILGPDFDPPRPGNNLTVVTDNLHIKVSSLNALQKIAENNPEIAKAVIDASKEAVAASTSRYKVGALAAAGIAFTMLAGSIAIILLRGVFEGLAFFVVCAAAAALYSAVFTGTSESLNWTTGLFGKSSAKGNTET